MLGDSGLGVPWALLAVLAASPASSPLPSYAPHSAKPQQALDLTGARWDM